MKGERVISLECFCIAVKDSALQRFVVSAIQLRCLDSFEREKAPRLSGNRRVQSRDVRRHSRYPHNLTLSR